MKRIKRKRPAYKEGQIPKAKWVPVKRLSRNGVVHVNFKLVMPSLPSGHNRHERLKTRSQFKHGN